MKVLIVDDNDAIKDTIKDVLTENGHEVSIAGNVEEAVNSISAVRPDVILLDFRINGEDGLLVPIRVNEQNPQIPLNVILLKGMTDEVPKDNTYVKGYVDKPFTSADIIQAVNMVNAASVLIPEKDTKKKGFFRKKEKFEPAVTIDLTSKGIFYGNSYVIFEPSPDKIYRFITYFNPNIYGALVVSSDKAKNVRQRFSNSDLQVLTLGMNSKGDTEDITALGSIAVRITEFINSHQRPVVFFDNFDDIIEANGLNMSLVLIHQLIRGASREVTFGVSMDASNLTVKDRNIVLDHMNEYNL